MKTGWPPGMLQDDDNRLSRWLANRPGARYQVRKNMTEQPLPLRLAEECMEIHSPHMPEYKIAAELRRLYQLAQEQHTEIYGLRLQVRNLLKALEQYMEYEGTTSLAAQAIAAAKGQA